MARKEKKTQGDVKLFARKRFERGDSYATISAALKGAGLNVPVSTLKSWKSREGWSRNSVVSETIASATTCSGSAEFDDCQLQPQIESTLGDLGSGFGGVVIPPDSRLLPVPVRTAVARADIRLEAIEARHDSHRAKVVSSAIELIEGSVATLRKLQGDGPVPPASLKQLADALHRGSEMLGNAEDRERKARGLDRQEVVNPNAQGVTQILINVQAPPQRNPD